MAARRRPLAALATRSNGANFTVLRTAYISTVRAVAHFAGSVWGGRLRVTEHMPGAHRSGRRELQQHYSGVDSNRHRPGQHPTPDHESLGLSDPPGEECWSNLSAMQRLTWVPAHVGWKATKEQTLPPTGHLDLHSQGAYSQSQTPTPSGLLGAQRPTASVERGATAVCQLRTGCSTTCAVTRHRIGIADSPRSLARRPNLTTSLLPQGHLPPTEDALQLVIHQHSRLFELGQLPLRSSSSSEFRTGRSRLRNTAFSSFGSVHSNAMPRWLSRLVEAPFFGMETILEVRQRGTAVAAGLPPRQHYLFRMLVRANVVCKLWQLQNPGRHSVDSRGSVSAHALQRLGNFRGGDRAGVEVAMLGWSEAGGEEKGRLVDKQALSLLDGLSANDCGRTGSSSCEAVDCSPGGVPAVVGGGLDLLDHLLNKNFSALGVRHLQVVSGESSLVAVLAVTRSGALCRASGSGDHAVAVPKCPWLVTKLWSEATHLGRTVINLHTYTNNKNNNKLRPRVDVGRHRSHLRARERRKAGPPAWSGAPASGSRQSGYRRVRACPRRKGAGSASSSVSCAGSGQYTSARMRWPASWSRRRRSRSLGRARRARAYSAALVTCSPPPILKARPVARASPVVEQDGLDHRLEQRRALAVWEGRRVQDGPHGVEGRPSESTATPQVVEGVRYQAAEVHELLNARQQRCLPISASAVDVGLDVGGHGEHDGLLRVDHQTDARSNANQTVQLTLGALDGQQGEIIGVAQDAEATLWLAAAHTALQEEAIVGCWKGASVSPWSTPDDVSKGSSTGCNRVSRSRLNSFAAMDIRQMPRCSSSLVVPGFFGMPTMCAMVHSVGAGPPASTLLITRVTSVATQLMRSASIGTSSGPSALPPGVLKARVTTSAGVTGLVLNCSTVGTGVSGGSCRSAGSVGGGGALTMAAKNVRRLFLRSSGVSPARLSAARCLRPGVDGGPGHAAPCVRACSRDGSNGVVNGGELPLLVARASLCIVRWLATQTDALHVRHRLFSGSADSCTVDQSAHLERNWKGQRIQSSLVVLPFERKKVGSFASRCRKEPFTPTRFLDWMKVTRRAELALGTPQFFTRRPSAGRGALHEVSSLKHIRSRARIESRSLGGVLAGPGGSGGVDAGDVQPSVAYGEGRVAESVSAPSPSPPPRRRGRRGRQSTLKAGAKCLVCDLLASGKNFGVATCESCKTFFRRNAKRDTSQLRCLHQNSCNISKEYRRSCTSCRLNKCFAVGMKKDLILPDEKLRSRARPTFKKPRYRWCRVPADIDDSQLMSALTSVAPACVSLEGVRFGGMVKQEPASGSFDDQMTASASGVGEGEIVDADDSRIGEEDGNDDDEATRDAGVVAAVAAAASSSGPITVNEVVDDADSETTPILPGEFGQTSALRSFDPRWQTDGRHFETTPIYHQLCLCVTDYQLPYDQQCASTLSSKLFNLEDGFSTLEKSVRKMIRLIPAMPILSQLDKNLLGKLVKLRVFGAIQIISVLSYDYDRDAWVVLFEAADGLEEAVLHTREAIIGTFMSLTSKRWLDDRALYSVSDVERIYQTLTDYYRDMLRLFGGHRKVAAVVLLAIYLLEEDRALLLSSAEQEEVRQAQSQYLSHLDGIAKMCESESGEPASRIVQRALLALLRVRWLDVRYSDGSRILQVARVPPLMQELAAT
uniref:Nuclear receptor domain-containing protein n=1 Tax=Macrostomum lignano TaxID=282301 RepID=A0A1I8GKR3_9PLAT